MTDKSEDTNLSELAQEYEVRKFVFFTKVGCVFSMFVVSVLPHVEFRPYDHQEDASHFTVTISLDSKANYRRFDSG